MSQIHYWDDQKEKPQSHEVSVDHGVWAENVGHNLQITAYGADRRAAYAAFIAGLDQLQAEITRLRYEAEKQQEP